MLLIILYFFSIFFSSEEILSELMNQLSIVVGEEGANILVVALWIFYSSMVFLFGASFTKAYSYDRGKPIESASYAYKFKEVRDNQNLPN